MARDFSPEAVHSRRWLTLIVLSTSLVVISIDNTILNVALPTIQEDTSATNTQLQWIVDSYTLVFASLLLTAGTIGDRFGRKGTLAAGLAVFGIFSLLSGLTKDPVQLIVTRALMGVGGAMIMPTTLSLLTNIFKEEEERVRAIAIWAAVMGAGVALGPIAGGVLIDLFGTWEPVFFVNVPIVIVALVAGYYLIPPSRDPTEPKLDVVGAVLTIIGLTGIVFAIIEVPIAVDGFTNPMNLAALGIGIVCIVAFVFWELHTTHPMVDVSLFRNMRFTAASLALTLNFFALMGAIFILTQYLQNVHGYSALEAGVRTLPLSLMLVFIPSLSARLDTRLGSKATVGAAMGVVTIGFLVSAMLTTTSPYWFIAVALLLLGLGMATAMTPATNSIMGALPPEKAGVGSAVNDTTRQIGGALGVAVLGSMLTARYASRLDESLNTLPTAVQDQISGVRETIESSIAGAIELGKKALAAGAPADLVDEITGFAKQAFVDGQRIAMLVGAGCTFLGMVIVLVWLPARSRPGGTDDQDGKEVASARGDRRS